MTPAILHKAVFQLRPGAAYTANGLDPVYADITWFDQVQTKPSQAEFDAAVTQVQVAEAAAAARLLTDQTEAEEAKADSAIMTVLNMKPAQIGAQIDAAFPDAAQRVVIKRLARLAIIAARRSLR